MSTRFSLEAILTATDKMTAPMKKAQQSTLTFSKKMQNSFKAVDQSMIKMNNGINKVIKTGIATAGVAIAATSAAVIKLTNDTATAGDEIAKTSRQIGMSAEMLQELRFASDRQGVSSETLTKSLKLLNRNVGDLRANTGTLTTFLNKTNPAFAEQLKNVENNEQAFNLLLGEINKLPNQMDKAALAQAAFGRSGQDLLKLFEAGPDGIKALREEAAKYGIISTDAANQSEAYVDAMTNLKAVANGLKITLATELIPVIADVATKVKDFVLANRELITQNIQDTITRIKDGFKKSKPFIQSVVEGIKKLAENFDKYKPILKNVLILFGLYVGAVKAYMAVKIISNIFKAAKAFMALAKAQGIVNAVMTANPVGLIIVGIAALIAIIVLLVKNWDKVVNAFKIGVDAVVGFFTRLWSKVTEIFTGIIDQVKADAALFMGVWKPVIDAVGGFFTGLWDGIKTGFHAVFDPIMAFLKNILDKFIAPIVEGAQKVADFIGVGKGAGSDPDAPASDVAGRYAAAASIPQNQLQQQRITEEKTQRHEMYLNAPNGWSMSTMPGGAPQSAVNLGEQ
jgi:hypothetical protein